ncbi:MAG: hypothetical protein IJ074_10585 [Clostridia bacterium]|nr:hypothetical protein [Clostridia bacterium]
MKPITLIIMAAGLASRYGSAKQIAGMGPNGEILMEYSMMDAIRAGFNRIVFVIRPELKPRLEEIIQTRYAGKAEFEYAVQDFSSVPAAVPAGRVKPYGTIHAVLCAKPYVSGPFAVINADDFYGQDAFTQMARFLRERVRPGAAAMVGYRLQNTVSPYGTVTRGVCERNGDMLAAIREVPAIAQLEDGRICATREGAPDEPLSADDLVSMNFWGFDQTELELMNEAFGAFLCALSPNELKAEYLLPVFVGERLRENTLSVQVLPTSARWFGVTYPQDRPQVVERLAALHAAGDYPI